MAQHDLGPIYAHLWIADILPYVLPLSDKTRRGIPQNRMTDH